MRKSAFLVGLLAALLVGLSVCGSGYAGPLQPNATFNGSVATGGMAFSADAVGFRGGDLSVDTTAATQPVTVQAAYLYNVTVFPPVPPLTATQASLGGNVVTLSLLSGADPTPCCNLQTYRADVTTLVGSLVNGKFGLTLNIAASPISPSPNSEGLVLVVVFSSLGLDPRQSVAIIDGGQAGPATQTTAFGLSSALDPNFSAVLSLGIHHSQQGGGGSSVHFCGDESVSPGEFSTVDVNGRRLTSCAGGADDGILITVGGVGDSTVNPVDPFCRPGTFPGKVPCSVEDDELYDIASFLVPGDREVRITTANPSDDDSIFLGILQLTGCIDQINGVSQGPCAVVPPPPPPPGVPGPATVILLGVGLLGLIAASRLFRKP